jgi:hypothetical protein
LSESDDTDPGNDPSTGGGSPSRGNDPEETTGSLLGEALDLITAMLADLVGASAADPDDFDHDLDRLSQIAGRLRKPRTGAPKR